MVNQGKYLPRDLLLPRRMPQPTHFIRITPRAQQWSQTRHEFGKGEVLNKTNTFSIHVERFIGTLNLKQFLIPVCFDVDPVAHFAKFKAI